MLTQINCWIKGDDAAFEPLFYHYRPRIYGYALKYIKSETRAEDLAMEILMKIWQSRQKISAPQTFENYIFVIARNHIVNEWHKTIDNLLSLENLDVEPFETPDPIVYEELEEAYRKGLSDLPEQRRKIFLMHREQNLSYKEIAAQLDISPKTVENQIGATLKHLRSKLSLHLNGFFF